MCAALSSYARACATKGVMLWGWRELVCSECCPLWASVRVPVPLWAFHVTRHPLWWLLLSLGARGGGSVSGIWVMGS